jgi:hypothetical protein
MKKVTKPFENEEAVYYSDFSGKLLNWMESPCIEPPVKLIMEFNYGSKHDGSKLELDLDDDDAKLIVDFLKNKLSKESKKEKLNFI